MPRDAVSRTANVERTGRHEWLKVYITHCYRVFIQPGAHTHINTRVTTGTVYIYIYILFWIHTIYIILYGSRIFHCGTFRSQKKQKKNLTETNIYFDGKVSHGEKFTHDLRLYDTNGLVRTGLKTTKTAINMYKLSYTIKTNGEYC